MEKAKKLLSIICVLSVMLSACTVCLSTLGSAVSLGGAIDIEGDNDGSEVEIDYDDFELPGDGNNNVWVNMHINGETRLTVGTVGTTLPEIPTVNNEKGMGWKSASGAWITTVPESTDEDRNVHIYAVYPTKEYDFEKGMGDIFMPGGNRLGSFELSAVSDPLESGRGTVLKINPTSKNGSTAQIPLSYVSGFGNTEGFKLNDDSEYTITMDVYLAENYFVSGNNSWNFYYSAYEGVGNAGNKTSGSYFAKSEQDKYLATNTEDDHHWATVTHTFTASIANGRDYLIITWNFGDSESNDKLSVVYVDNIKIVETGEAVYPFINSTVNLDLMGGALNGSKKLTAEYNSKVMLPTPEKSGYVFAGWTKNQAIAAGTASNDQYNMDAEYAPQTVVLAKGRTMDFYAIWAPNSVTYTFGSPDNTVFNNALTTTERLTTGEGGTGSGGTVSTYLSLEDCDGDGGYELKTNVGDGRYPSVFKANLATYDGTNNNYYCLREGVTYRVTINVKVAELNNSSAKIGVTRCYRTGFGQVNPEGSNQRDYLNVASFKETTDGFVTVSKEFTVFGMFNTSYSGQPGDGGLYGAFSYKDGLAFVGYSGVTYVKSITVEALSYNEPTLSIIGDGTVDVDYINKKVTVSPASGYKLAAGGITMTYNYHGFDTEKYGKYSATEEQIAHLTEAYEAKKKVFINDSVSTDTDDTFLYTDKLDMCPSGIKFTVEFVPDSEMSTAVIARSVRTDKTLSNGLYRTAGLRFRARVANDDRITEVGFIAVPSAKLIGDTKLEFLEDGSLSCRAAATAVAYKKADGTNVLYSAGAEYKDYQLIITGLSTENGERSLKDTEFTVVSYVKYDDGGTVKYRYSEHFSASWNDVWNSYSDEIKNQYQ